MGAQLYHLAPMRIDWPHAVKTTMSQVVILVLYLHLKSIHKFHTCQKACVQLKSVVLKWLKISWSVRNRASGVLVHDNNAESVVAGKFFVLLVTPC